MSQPDFAAPLEAALKTALPGVTGLTPLTRLSGGASQETWSFDALTATGPLPLILRRAPGGARDRTGSNAITLETEARVISLAVASGVAAPPVRHVLAPHEGVGQGYVMDRLAGETIARKILRDAEFDAARPHLASDCGRILARIHRTDPGAVPELKTVTGPDQLRLYRDLYDAYNYPHPMFEYAFKWLEERMQPPKRLTLVHGDFRHGNLLIDREGVRAALDWELAHIGDPLEDLGWVCVNSWRFGSTHKIVGGFGDVEDMLAAYIAEGGTPYTAEDVKTWEIYGSLKWGVMCMTMYQAFATDSDRSVERAAIGRRSSETEIDLVNLLLAEEMRR